MSIFYLQSLKLNVSMNLGVFNRVNFKDSESGGMYSEWASLCAQIQGSGTESVSVLDKLSSTAGKDVALVVVKQLAANLGITQAAEPSPLVTDKEVLWSMEVICYGLSLPLTEHDTIRDCVSIYCEWLSSLLSVPKVSVPKPICDDPNLYARKIIGHFHKLFVPRKGEALDTINRQAVLCHRVLRTLQHLAQSSTIMKRETWESLLMFLLAINDTLLSPPTVKDDVGDQLCERVLSVLLEVWLIACVRCFPSPPLWKTLREMCMNWRHRIALVEQWNRVHLTLTSRLLELTYGPEFPLLKISEEDAQLIPQGATHDCVVQSWYRFLHTLGNPVNLSRPDIISQTPKFLQFAITNDTLTDPSQHPCLNSLPLVFLKAIRGIASQVDAFLGLSSGYIAEDVTGEKKEKEQPPSTPTPPTQRRLAKSFSVAPSSVTKGIPKSALMGLTSSRVTSVPPSSTANSGPSSTSSQASVLSMGNEPKTPLTPSRPKCNSILHLFGNWLFEAANIGCENITRVSGASNRVSKSLLMDHRKSSVASSSQPNSLTDDPDMKDLLNMDKYSAGRAEALGALCRLFTAKKTGEEILPVYLARFYVSLQQGLQIPPNRECTEAITSILLNCSDLFRLDLDGVMILLPNFIDALELVLPEKDLNLKCTNVSKTELRHASIHLLLSILALPLHFQNLQLKELIPSANDNKHPITVIQLKSRLMNLLMNALQVETDGVNTQMLLGGLLLSVQDTAACEENEFVSQPELVSDTTSNLFSSGSDTTSGRSVSLSDRLGYAEDSSDLATDTNYDSAHALFVRATYLVCHRLISSWKTDLNVSLAALELLSGLARVNIKESDALESKRAVKWLCDYIVYQCRRPPPAHSKDLHSTIVAAFHCCSVWLVAHPYILHDKDCLLTVLEVVELGISGTISQGKPSEPVKMKDEKELKPASMRVRDAAENLLYNIFEQVGYFPSPCGPESLSSLLDEVSLLKHCNSWPGGDIDRVTACQRFKYFIVENSILLAILEEPLGNDQDPQPTVTLLIRGPFGRHSWTMQLRHLPRHKSGMKHQHSSNPGRPVPLNDVGVKHDVRHQYFPDCVEKIPMCKADRSIPSMDSLITDDKIQSEHERMLELIDHQMELEEAMKRVGIQTENSLQFPDPERECNPPPVCHEFQTARLFLSHFGLLSLDSNKDYTASPLTVLDTNLQGFCSDLEALDCCSSRTCDTVHVFYVKAGQKSAQEILDNVNPDNTIDGRFMEMLISLGWPVNVFQHPGWTGHTSTSWRLQPFPEHSQNPDEEMNQGPSLFSGEKYVLYWADVSSEIAFLVPTCKSLSSLLTDSFINSSVSSQLSGQGWYERSVSVSSSSSKNQLKPRTLSLDLEKQNVSEPTRPGRRTGASRSQPFTDPPTKVFLVWLESFEDNISFPVGDLLPYTNTGQETVTPRAEETFVIFLHALNTGLLRVKLQGPIGRMSLSTPLVDGLVVSRRALGSLVRQTALNICKKKRLDSESYHPPHVKRRLKVQDLAARYQSNMNQAQLLAYLFTQK